MVVDLLAERLGGRFKAHRGRADLVEGALGPPGVAGRTPVVLAKPKSYMNESGGPVASLRDFFKVPARADRRRPRRARPPVRHAAAQARRRRQRPQRAAVGDQVARRPGLPAGALRDRPPARAAPTRPPSCSSRSRRPRPRSCRSWWTGPPTRSRTSSLHGLEAAQNRYHAEPGREARYDLVRSERRTGGHVLDTLRDGRSRLA